MTFVIQKLRALFRVLYYRNPLNLYIGQKVFGNDSGLLANTVGNTALKLDQLRSKASIKITNQFSTEVKHFRKHGWVKLEDIEFGETLDILKDKFDMYCENSIAPDSQRLEVTSITNNNELFQRFPEIKSVLTNKLQDFITEFYEAHFTVLNVHIYRIFSVPEQLKKSSKYRPYGATGCWHNDGSTVDTVKLFVLIDDVNEENGPLRIINSQDTSKSIRKNYYRYIHDGIPGKGIDQNNNVVKFTGKRGSVLLANPNTCLHRASEPKPGKHRDMLVFYLTSAASPLPQDWHSKATHHQTLGFSRLLAKYN